MRRKDKEIKEKIILEEILKQNQVGRLGTSVNGVPYIIPMNFAYIEDKILLHTHKEGKKVQNIRENPIVCFEVDSGEIIENNLPCNYSWKYYSVIAFGKAKIIEDNELKYKSLKIICDKYAFGKSSKLTLEMIRNLESLISIQIDIQHMTGKKSPA
jgi:nitroimidazol reductase NimA-like FMN-containing flavoprotein (pyridoxamine 5'-phosphate oxidase superfamily)